MWFCLHFQYSLSGVSTHSALTALFSGSTDNRLVLWTEDPSPSQSWSLCPGFWKIYSLGWKLGEIQWTSLSEQWFEYEQQQCCQKLKNQNCDCCRCDNELYGCSVVAKLDSLSIHLKECEHNPKKPVPCSQGCGLTVPKVRNNEFWLVETKWFLLLTG